MKKFKLLDLSKSTGEVFIFHKLIPQLKIQVITNDNFEYDKWNDIYDLFYFKKNEIVLVVTQSDEDLNEVTDYTPYRQVLKRAWKWYRSKVYIEDNSIELPSINEDDNYILQQSKDKGKWVCTDKINGIVVTWREREFNESQEITYINDIEPNVMKIARQQRLLSDWLVINHREKL
jgi:hypothetical protein